MLEINGASNRGIDEIRQIIENVRYQPAQCRFKIYVIDEVHQVTEDVQSLLKTSGRASFLGQVYPGDYGTSSTAGYDSLSVSAIRLPPHHSA